MKYYSVASVPPAVDDNPLSPCVEKQGGSSDREAEHCTVNGTNSKT